MQFCLWALGRPLPEPQAQGETGKLIQRNEFPAGNQR
jgi:hypothetical protein